MIFGVILGFIANLLETLFHMYYKIFYYLKKKSCLSRAEVIMFREFVL